MPATKVKTAEDLLAEIRDAGKVKLYCSLIFWALLIGVAYFVYHGYTTSFGLWTWVAIVILGLLAAFVMMFKSAGDEELAKTREELVNLK